MTELLSQSAIDMMGWALLHLLWQTVLWSGALAVLLALTRNPERRATAGAIALALSLASPVLTVMAGAATGTPSAIVVEKSRLILTDARYEPSPVETALVWLVAAWCGWVVLQTIRVGGATIFRAGIRLRAIAAQEDVSRAAERIASRLGLRDAVVCISSRLDTAQVSGVLRPAVLLPASALTHLTPSQIESILAHEFAHIARGDHWVNALQAVAEVLAGFHPGIRWMSRVVREEREYCCDAIAASVAGDRAGYVRALLALEEVAAAQALAASSGDLRARVARLLGHAMQAPPQALRPAVGVGMLLLAGGTLLAFSPLGSKTFVPEAPLANEAAMFAQAKPSPVPTPVRAQAEAKPVPKPSPAPRLVDGGPSPEVSHQLEMEIRRAEERVKQVEVQMEAAAREMERAAQSMQPSPEQEERIARLHAEAAAIDSKIRALGEVRTEEQRQAFEEAMRQQQAAMRKLDAEMQTLQETHPRRRAAQAEMDRARTEFEKHRQKLEAEVKLVQQNAERLHQAAAKIHAEHDAERKRRIEVARQRFGGENTERGRLYVRFGPPDEITAEGDRERWKYRKLPDVGDDVSFEVKK